MVKIACPVDAGMLVCSEEGIVLAGTECDACARRYEPSFFTETVFFLFTDFFTDVRALSDALVFFFNSVSGDSS